MRGFFVTGTDTGVGKSVVSAWLLALVAGDYWKPIQSGLLEPGDTEVVRRLSGCSEAVFHPERWRLVAPLSPHESARLEGVTLRLDDFSLPVTGRPLIVEGAGGVLVPLNATELMADLMVRLALPVIVVARTTLGTINHTLLTLEALRSRRLPLAGVVLNGAENPANREAIRHYGRVPILGSIPPLSWSSLSPPASWAVPSPEFQTLLEQVVRDS
ncbi:MAG: dethiobiotin synthase [Magnetococcales bacterium]|nr:dethiobiotin synthase [Magnetococcales bacterium]MBF0156889.1 dethiobiotin synthase [Magnetococcales bacterium]